MGTIHHLPNAADVHVRQLQTLVSDVISQHPDPEVSRIWAAMASETMGRYPGPPLPSNPELNLDAVEGLSPEQKQQVQKIVEQWLLSYFDDVRDQLMKVHFDLLNLQKTVAECEVNNGT